MNDISRVFPFHHRPILVLGALLGLLLWGCLFLLRFSTTGQAERVARHTAPLSGQPGLAGNPTRASGDRLIPTVPGSPPASSPGMGAKPSRGDSPPPSVGANLVAALARHAGSHHSEATRRLDGASSEKWRHRVRALAVHPSLRDGPPAPPPGRGVDPRHRDGLLPPKRPSPPAHTLRAWITGYDLTGITATGVPAGPGGCAVDPSVIPLGTMITIDGVGRCVANDTGSAVVGATVDVWVPDAQTAYQLTGGYTIHW